MKKIYLLAFICTFASIIKMQAYDFTAPDVNGNTIYYNYLGGDSVEVTYKDLSYYVDNTLYGYSGDVIIPSTISDSISLFRVTSIGGDAFHNCVNLTSIEIPNSITSIGVTAFVYCSSLTSINMPNSVTNIGYNAFSGCSSLTSVTIPSSVTSIGYSSGYYSSPFSDCSSLTSIVVELGNATYDSRNNCNAIIETATNTLIAGCKNTKIPYSVTSIREFAFVDCSGLTSLTLPTSVTSIKEGAFLRCNSLISIDIPKGVTTIGSRAFSNCSKLDTVICRSRTARRLYGENNLATFYGISPTAVLLVPYESLEAYKAIAGYADYFAEIKGFSDVGEVTDTTATLKWLPDTAVTQYHINVYTSGVHFAQYLVDGNGQLKSLQKFAPSIYHQKLDTTISSTDYFVITLDGLTAGTSYNYTIDGTNSQGAPIYHEEGSFTTLIPHSIDTIANEPKKQMQKILQEGQMYIIQGGDKFTIQGIKVNQ